MSESTADDEIQYPSRFGLRDVVGCGTTGMVVLDKSRRPTLLSRCPLTITTRSAFSACSESVEVYERFAQRGGHKGLSSYHGVFESGIRLEYAPHHNLRLHLEDSGAGAAQRLQWAIQVAEAIQFVHDAGVIHGDLTCANIFLDM
ncbi:hypothetical protein N656DRAFT_823837 [Canariomyces notabilis]|uniref:EKC/KEOPS complex subunit BUD32 n=1 Tax=Canariomyces notabilis TaxID=2074819 RepID=A0AAN6TF49_9PEZI|nr:hypothetical protein N656DRAFT_823837 [Canariomyces arenarius]